MVDPANRSSTPADPASQWYLGLLEREAALVGRNVRASQLADYLRLLPEGSVGAGAPASYALFSKLGNCSVRLNALTGETISWYIDALASGGNESMPTDAALALAAQVGQPPADAVLDVAGYETMAGRCSFRARWRHVVAGMPVEGDYIEVLVNGKHRRAYSLSKVWREPRLGSGPIER